MTAGIAIPDTRSRLLDTALRLFSERGMEGSSLQMIADELGVTKAAVYYHFKTKDDILDAVIVLRQEKTRAMLSRWESENAEPVARIGSFIEMLIMNRAKIKRYGCPVGSLCGELAKLEHSALGDANKLFTLFRHWLRDQFKALGRSDDADALAMHLLARSQGVAALAQAFHDEKFIKQEVGQMHAWLAECAATS